MQTESIQNAVAATRIRRAEISDEHAMPKLIVQLGTPGGTTIVRTASAENAINRMATHLMPGIPKGISAKARYAETLAAGAMNRATETGIGSATLPGVWVTVDTLAERAAL